jgi:divalent metal cation (Fe/Co/Zn/Cd) transporter
MEESRAYARRIWIIVGGIAALCAGETALALYLDNRLLLKDALEWLYDVAVYAMAAISFGRGARIEQISALVIAAVLTVAGLQGCYEIVRSLFIPPDAAPLTVGISAGLIIVEGIAVALALWRFRASSNPLIEATWLTARNDAVAAVGFAVVIAGARLAPMRWPQMLVEAFAAGLAFQAAWIIFRDARRSRSDVTRS